MNDKVRRIYVEKKRGFDIEAKNLYSDLKQNLKIKGLENVRVLNRYDISGVSENVYIKARDTIFSELNVDKIYEEELEVKENEHIFAVEYLPGQYDQRADSAAQCIQILSQNENPTVKTAKVIILQGDISEKELRKIKSYYINPVDSREASLQKPIVLNTEFEAPKDVAVLYGFIDMSNKELIDFAKDMGLAMSIEDLKFCQEYFKNTEKRDPTITEMRVIDTYWSDHCRHTTFLTQLEDISFEEGLYIEPIKKAYDKYLKSREYVYENKEKDICLMDIATIGMKELRKRGRLNDLEVSDEVNAASIIVNVDVDGKDEEWLVMFKNETHNHPTEIEPFGGAATCLGGAIRDPLSGRAYVYQAMRVTGSGDPRTSVEDTLSGKLPQIKITTEAAHGYSSYGNQIGLATGKVAEIYDENYIAKRMEIGAVIAAAPRKNVVRKKPEAGDVILLVGGRTGRDGCGGATGSSKAHTEESILTCGAEVQKGNPPTERKIQRLFRNPKVSTMIKKCNDFGAGGVSVAIGELADSLEIDLNAVPKKYEGLDGTELAISESQERMAVVLDKKDVEDFVAYAKEENLEATVVAKVTNDNRLKMMWQGKTILDINREFLDTNGVKRQAKVLVAHPNEKDNYFDRLPDVIENLNVDLKKAWIENLKDLNVAAQRGLVEMFDSTIGAGTVVMPFGGKYGLTPAEGMAAKIPVLSGETNTCTIMTHGYNPKLAKWSPFHGGLYAVIESIAKVVAMGGNYKNTRLTLQEYFEKLGEDKKKWGKPFSALLGAFYVQNKLGIPAIGGKDSMSGTFKDIHVPPTLVSFAVNTADARNVITPEFKKVNSKAVILQAERDKYGLPNFEKLEKNYSKIYQLIKDKKILAAHTVGFGGIAEAISKMCFGNKIGFTFTKDMELKKLFSPDYGSIVLEIEEKEDLEKLFEDIDYKLLGNTNDKKAIEVNNITIDLEWSIKEWEKPLNKVFEIKKNLDGKPKNVLYDKGNKVKPSVKIAKPRVFIPVFPGTNCEYDTARAFERAGGQVETLVFKNLAPSDIQESIDKMAEMINNSQIIALAGGFSAGDEPDGSGKFIATVFRNERIKEAVMNLLKNRDGLMLGICNGFQALIKLGLVPFGEIVDIKEDYPTLTFNKIGRHVSTMVRTKVVSNLSPWFNNVKVGDIHTIPVSHGEGRFVANEKYIKQMSENGQIATQYVDFEGNPSYDGEFNPNGSIEGVEGITSPDGRVLGKMGHSERIGNNLYKNVDGDKDQKIFEAGIKYFTS
ncbi:phosphoribosylformylglycinamidine synthase [Caldisalinibacter kiritimatiensis]|uniref:Phosphoribosylformylglycinamidine synthase n=1 Tax=Caldisalinibacter kiritimatiensis TaxID=1304284 RepID=R1ASM6_9FIRM|nr:phosphoribosylformylglycinamidine synthase [Caldisalinibacter kiritimatiensis]EOD00163.1 Phosphoribosylformylglycinamidine synthase [Caldisalinibacter kiritimatiensis]